MQAGHEFFEDPSRKTQSPASRGRSPSSELYYSGGQKHLEETVEGMLFGSPLSFVFIGLALGATILLGLLVDYTASWVVRALLSMITYIGFFALRLSIAGHLLSRSDRS